MHVDTDQIRAYTDPRRGEGTFLYFSPRSPRPIAAIECRTVPWLSSRRAPFACEVLVQPERALLRLVASRKVAVKGRLDVPAGVNEPLVETYRVQDDSLIPVDGKLRTPNRMLGNAFLWVEGMSLEATATQLTQFGQYQLELPIKPPLDRKSAMGRPLPDGLEAVALDGNWRLRIQVPDMAPAAFAYEVYAPQPFGFFIRVVCTPNVRIHERVTVGGREGASQLFVLVARVRTIDEVPAQGTPLRDRGLQFEPNRDSESRVSAEPVAAANMMFGIIPYVGAIYDIAQFVYVMTNERDFFGWPASTQDKAMFGISAALAAGGAFTKLAETLARGSKLAGFAKLLRQRAVITALQESIDADLMQLIGQIQRSDLEELENLTIKTVRNETSPVELLAAYQQRVQQKLVEKLGAERLAEALSEDLRSFTHAELAATYNEYSARAGAAAADPVIWASRQTTGRARNLLVRLYGPQFADTLRTAIKESRILIVSDEALTTYDSILSKTGGLGDYGDLTKLKRGFETFEADHLIETRFMATLPAQTGAHDMLALLVPKNPGVADQLVRRGRPVYYAHSVKTAMLRELIPHGLEPAFDMQYWVDAHINVYERLGVPEWIIEAFIEEVDFLTNETHQTVEIHRGLSKERFFQ